MEEVPPVSNYELLCDKQRFAVLQREPLQVYVSYHHFFNHKNGRKPKQQRIAQWKYAHRDDAIPKELIAWLLSDKEANATFLISEDQLLLFTLDAMRELCPGSQWFKRLHRRYFGNGGSDSDQEAPEKEKEEEDDDDDDAEYKLNGRRPRIGSPVTTRSRATQVPRKKRTVQFDDDSFPTPEEEEDDEEIRITTTTTTTPPSPTSDQRLGRRGKKGTKKKSNVEVSKRRREEFEVVVKRQREDFERLLEEQRNTFSALVEQAAYNGIQKAFLEKEKGNFRRELIYQFFGPDKDKE